MKRAVWMKDLLEFARIRSPDLDTLVGRKCAKPPAGHRGSRQTHLTRYFLSQRENFIGDPYLVLIKKCELAFLGGWRTEGMELITALHPPDQQPCQDPLRRLAETLA